MALVLVLFLATRAPHGRAPVGGPVRGVVAIVEGYATMDDVFAGQFCGGVVVADSLVLTAAHCVSGRRATDLQVLVGGDNLCQSSPVNGYLVAVRELRIDPMYEPSSAAFDRAYVTVDRVLRNEIRGVEDVVSVPTATDAVALGWGRRSPSGVPACRLERVNLTLLPLLECSQTIVGDARHTFDVTSMFCANPEVDGADTCSGDSGGPVILGKDPAVGAVLGVVSWGTSCGVGAPSVYARAASG